MAFNVDPLRYATPARPAEFDFSQISRLGDAIGAYRQKQAIEGALAEATDEKGNLDFAKAGTALSRLGLLDQARPLLTLAEARANRTRTEGHQKAVLEETIKHNRTVEDIARSRVAAQNSAEGELDDPTAEAMAKQYRAGDTSIMTNLGRGAQGAKNVIKLRKTIARQNDEEGVTPAEQALRNAEFMGEKAGQRSLATRTTQIEVAATEFKRVLPIVTEASNAVDRTNYPSLNKIIQMYREGTGDPNIVRFASGVNSLVNLYARAISPTGTATVSDKDHAREILNKAWSNGQFDAATGIMTQEIDAALLAPKDVKQHMRERFIGGQAGAKSAPAATTPPAAPAQAAPAAPTRRVQSTAEANREVALAREQARKAVEAGFSREEALAAANRKLQRLGAPTIGDF